MSVYEPRLRSYEGSEPYIFVSYAHRDSELVWPLLDRLADEGFRIWYDDGIAPGSEWPEYIAEHLDASAAVLAFISPNSVESQNCRREIHYSLDKGKSFVYVMLEKTELTKGLEMQLSSQNGILKQNFASEKKFYEKLHAVPLLQPCRASAKELVPAEEKTVLIVEQPAVSQIETVAERYVTEEKPVKPPKKRRKGLGYALLALVAVAVLVSAGKKLFANFGVKVDPMIPYAAAEQVASVDPRLVGEWRRVDGENKGSINPVLKANLFYSNLLILPDGTLEIDQPGYRFKDYALSGGGDLFPRITAEDGVTDLFSVAVALCRENKDEKAEKCSDLAATYELTPATAEEIEEDPFLTEDDLTNLTVHYVGTYREDALSTQQIDWIVHYTRQASPEELLFACLYGNWTDGSNSWSFDHNSRSEESYNAELDFVMKTEDGKKYTGDKLYSIFDNATGETELKMHIAETEKYYTYRVESISYDRIVLRSDVGDLILTRVY